MRLCTNNNDGVGIFVVIGLVICGGALLPMLRAAPRIYVTDEEGVTRSWFLVKKTLPWTAIDWVYPRRKTTTTYTPLGAKVRTSTQDCWVIEAGPRRRLNVPTDALGGISARDFQPLLEMIKTRLPAQSVGYQQAARVKARRKTS